VPKIHNVEKTASSTNVAGKTGYLPAESSNSKGIEDLSIKPETLKLVQERAQNILA
jgi:hypothetical protein